METFFKFFTHRWHDLDTVLIGIPCLQPVHLFEDDYRKLREFVAQNYPAWDEKRETLEEQLWHKFRDTGWCQGLHLLEREKQLVVHIRGKIPAADFESLQEQVPVGYALLIERAPETAEVPDHVKQKSW